MSDPASNPSDPLTVDVPKVVSPHTSVVGRLRNYFLTGLVVAGPLAITVWLIWSFINWVDGLVRPFIPPAYRPETYLPWPIPGTGLIIALVGADAARLPHSKLGRAHSGRLGRGRARPHADRAANLQDDEADFRDPVLEDRIEFPQGGAGGVSRARHVVAGIPVAAAERRYCVKKLPQATMSRPSCRARPTRPPVLLLRAAQGSDRARHYGRERDDAADFGRHGAARAATAQKKLAALADQARKAAHARKTRRSRQPNTI